MWRSLLCILSVALAAPAFAEGTSSYGIAAGAFVSQFIGGMSGPETPLSATRYYDTFDTGAGLRLEVFREFPEAWRGQLGLVYSRWPGQFFTGGEFPSGAQFDDFSLAGAYIGGTYRMRRREGYEPYFLGNFGLVYLSSLTVTSAGSTIPYWSGNWRDYLELGVGVARRAGAGSLTLDLRLQLFGKPKSENWPIAEATGGQSVLLGLGYEWGLR
jgi:hypothetical protein